MRSSQPPPNLRIKTLQILLDLPVRHFDILWIPHNSEICIYNSLDFFKQMYMFYHTNVRCQRYFETCKHVCSFLQLMFVKFIHVVGDTAVPSPVPRCVWIYPALPVTWFIAGGAKQGVLFSTWWLWDGY